jgi:hypothetical protein
MGRHGFCAIALVGLRFFNNIGDVYAAGAGASASDSRMGPVACQHVHSRRRYEFLGRAKTAVIVASENMVGLGQRSSLR